MAQNEGKKFEQDFKLSFGDEYFVYRLRDNAASFGDSKNTRFASYNICDFIIFHDATRTLYLVELKSTKSSSIPYTMIKDNQINGLAEASIHSVVPCFIFNYRENNNATYFMHINNFLTMKNELNKKSFGGDLLTNGTVFSNNVIKVNNGGTHEENPMEGI